MNVPPQLSGQIPGQVPSQGGAQLSGLHQQNVGGGSLPSQMQNMGVPSTMDRELLLARRLIRDRITQYIQRHQFAGDWMQRLPDLARRVDEYLYRNAQTKEDYMNMETLDHRLHSIIKNLNSQSQAQAQKISSSTSMSTMIPTPGMAHGGTMNMPVTSAADSSMITTSSTGTLVATKVGTGSILHTANGSLPDTYQQSSVNNSIGSSGNIAVQSMGISRNPSQMIPTPGLNNQQSMSMNPGSTGGGGYSGVDSAMMSQQQHQKQFVGNQNSRILHNLGGQLGVGLRSNMQHKYGFPNGGLTLIGNNKQLVNGSMVSEGYLSAPAYNNSPKPMQQHFDQQQRHQSIRTRDGFGMNDLAGGGNLYGTATSSGSVINSQNMNSLSMQSRSKTILSPQTYQPNLQSIQQASHKPQVLEHSQKMDFQAPLSTRENLLQPQQPIQKFQHQQFQQQASQPYSQFVQQQFLQQQKQQNQQLLLENDTFRQSLLTSSLSGQLMSEHGMESLNEPLLSQAPDEFNLPELPSQYQRNNMADDNSVGNKLASQVSGSQNLQPSLTGGSQQIQQIFHQNQQAVETQNNFSSLSSGSQPEVLLQGHWHSQPLQKSHIMNQASFEQHIQNEFQQQIIGQGEARGHHGIVDEPVSGQGVSIQNNMAVPKPSNLVSVDAEHAKQYIKQQRWLLFLFHARWCTAPKGKCLERNCITAQCLIDHMRSCNQDNCLYARCQQTKNLTQHHRKCRAVDCPVCVPVREFIALHSKPRLQPDAGSVYEINGSWKTANAADADNTGSKTSSSSIETSEDLQSSMKRMKVEHQEPRVSKSEISSVSIHDVNQLHTSQEAQGHLQHPVHTCMPAKFEAIDVKAESSISSGLENPPNLRGATDDDTENGLIMRPSAEQVLPSYVDCQPKQESMQIDKDYQAKIDVKQEANASSADLTSGTKSGKPKIKGVSLTELFTPEQVGEHITGLRQWVGQSKAKAEKNQAMEHSMSENSCQLCAVEKLTFEPPPIYCTPCGARIKRNAMYYTFGNSDTRQYFCIPCYNEARGDSIEVEGSVILKARLEKKRNDEETEEWWVQCDKCEAWQHQICALFNGRRNDGGQAEYTCPNCYVQEIERGERKPLPQSAVLGAEDLPKTLLSDHLEQRLFRRLKQERQERARHHGKTFDEVPGAEALVIRVVSSVDKKLEVKQRFLEIFQEDNYPTEFPYKSKVVLLFQKIEGVEVCLFGMYVQEFGSECQFPNQRRVYLSYLDSVKYFRPEIKTVTGEALRTFVYHEILIGYLEYCKKRGFTSCYIWACPPLKGEDYILYCHPEIQKTPKSDKLREWYLAMLRKAVKENIVVDLTNLYDHFFITMGECKAKVTAARLPYFDGDYWPGAAEDMINQLQQEEDGRKQQKKGKTKKTITKRALKAAGHTDLSGNASKDAMLMHKLGETIYPMKEDFIMVHLQHACTHCCLLMVSGIRWVCNQCKNFQLCEKCYDVEQKLEERERHPINSREKHLLNPVAINDVPSDTKDKDEILESEFFDTRQAFLSLCQGNHYQYDTLRRAKHSSMMVLYHLHNPTAPAFVTTCNVCHHDIEAGQGWRCEICPDFDVCNSCYQKDGGVDHPHMLTNHPSNVDAQNTEARQKRVLQLRKMLDLLVHASQCRVVPFQSVQCQYPNCRKVKGLFRHGRICKTRASGGCLLCKKMWYLLQLHARACKESECHVPRCKDLKEHLRRLQQQSDSRRRAAVMEMMRQRAAEVAGST